MRKTKEQKGITLIALIITIIVLLILAVVAISAVQDDGIINYAKNARDQYGAEQEKENTTLQNYLDMIKENVPTGTGTNEGNQGKTITFTINGVQYTAENGMTLKQWAESDYDVDDKFIYVEKNDGIAKIILDGGAYTMIFSNADFTKHAPVNIPIVDESAYYHRTD